MIYLKLRGRIGNQLFMYAAARRIQLETGEKQLIVVDNSQNILVGWENALEWYDLPRIEYHNDNKIYRSIILFPQRVIIRLCRLFERKMNHRERKEFQSRIQALLNRFGVFLVDDGYIAYPSKYRKNTVVEGYFQSERFFYNIKDEIIRTFSLMGDPRVDLYPHIDDIRERNTVCISIKIEHNAGNQLYDVCNDTYYKRAIEYIKTVVPNPLFFVCSDNIEYVKNNLIDTTQYDVIEQNMDTPIQLSLAAMSECKYFIIGNTTFGWWAQYLCTYPDKIVIAPARWYNEDVPCDLYMDDWMLMEV